jgi:hypothetical protein
MATVRRRSALTLCGSLDRVPGSNQSARPYRPLLPGPNSDGNLLFRR